MEGTQKDNQVQLFNGVCMDWTHTLGVISTMF